MKNKLIAAGIVTGALLSYSSNIFADTLRFPDVPKWAEQSVNYLVDKHAINGLPNGTFGSYETLDRASAATIITKALGIKINQNEKPSFKDAQNHLGAPYIAAAEKAGIVNGVGNGLFNPSGKVTRAAMATMLVNAYKLQSPAESEAKTIFKDLKGHWGEKSASILIDLGISNGTDNGWQPDKLVTRAEAAQLTAKSDMLQNRAEGALNSSKEKISNKIEGYMDGVVSSIIRDTNGDCIKVNYNDNDGKDHSVYVWASKKHDFEEGDTVKVSKIGNYGETVYHKSFRYQTTQYDNAKSKVLTDSQGAITKVNEKQNEELVMGEIEDIFKDESVDYIGVRLKDNEGKKQYVDVPVPQGHSYKKGDKVKVGHKEEWEKKVNNKYMIAWISPEGSISKVNEEQKEEFEIGEVEGITKDKSIDYIEVKLKDNEGKKQYVDVPIPQGHSYKKGDKVKVGHKEEWEKKVNNRNMTAWIGPEGAISKVTGNEKQNEDFVIGEIYNAERYHVSVKYINNKGQTDYVHVNTSHEHNFKDRDRVKVINKKSWDGRFALEGSISKFNENEKQNEDFVIGEIYNAEKYHVSVKYINNKGQTDYVHMNTSHGHDFKDGDRVKVINKKNWDGRFTLEGSISKVND
ncbi:S-layer homology domain-containing protein [Bacillus sp. 1A]|uniref:S-layer homology domain-containing protein n=1 Tax=Bacillus sp. 1A TaxID=3461399 RepID=UPI0040444FD1